MTKLILDDRKKVPLFFLCSSPLFAGYFSINSPAIKTRFIFCPCFLVSEVDFFIFFEVQKNVVGNSNPGVGSGGGDFGNSLLAVRSNTLGNGQGIVAWLEACLPLRRAGTLCALIPHAREKPALGKDAVHVFEFTSLHFGHEEPDVNGHGDTGRAKDGVLDASELLGIGPDLGENKVVDPEFGREAEGIDL